MSFSESNLKEYLSASLHEYIDDFYDSSDDDVRDPRECIIITCRNGEDVAHGDGSIYRNVSFYELMIYGSSTSLLSNVLNTLKKYPVLDPVTEFDFENADDEWATNRSNEQAYHGSYSKKVNTGFQTYTFTDKIQPERIDIAVFKGNAYFYFDIHEKYTAPNTKILLSIQHGTGNYFKINGSNTTASFALSTWYLCSFRDINYTSKTFKFYVNDVYVDTLSFYHAACDGMGYMSYNDGGYGSSTYIDYIRTWDNGWVELYNLEKSINPKYQYLGKKKNGQHKWQVLFDVQVTETVS